MMPVAILCGGKGTRLAPLTDHRPKSLMDVCGKPFIVRQLELLKRHGYTDIVLLINHFGDQIRKAVGDGSDYGVSVRYSEDGPTLKTRDDAIWQSPVYTSAGCFVLYGDSYLDCDYQMLERVFLVSGYARLETVFGGEGYGLRAFRRIGTNTVLTVQMPRPYEEIGSFDGLARVRELFRWQ